MRSGASGYSYLLDTNIILYPQDPTDTARKMRATELLVRLGGRSSVALPAQALAEFANVALRKFVPPMDWSAIYRKVQELEQAFPVLPLTPEVVFEALLCATIFFPTTMLRFGRLPKSIIFQWF